VDEDAPSILLSRVAESAYWAGRYLERAEGIARLVKTHADLVMDLPRDASVGWQPLLAVLGVTDADDAATLPTTEEGVISLLVADSSNASSVRASIAAAHRNLRVTRAVMPIEAGEVLTDLHHQAEETSDEAIDRRTRSQWLTSVIRHCQTLSAILRETMSHDDAYNFFTVGRQLERADMTTRVLDSQRLILTRMIRGPLEPYLDLCWYAALRSVSALQPFRRSGLPTSAEATVSFLLRNTRSPRSVEHCMIEAARAMLEISHHEHAMSACAAVQKLLSDADIAELCDGGLHEFIDEVQLAIGEVHGHMAESWFLPQPIIV
jgi:uncharacterized alpha-E superfamily protein